MARSNRFLASVDRLSCARDTPRLLSDSADSRVTSAYSNQVTALPGLPVSNLSGVPDKVAWLVLQHADESAHAAREKLVVGVKPHC